MWHTYSILFLILPAHSEERVGGATTARSDIHLKRVGTSRKGTRCGDDSKFAPSYVLAPEFAWEFTQRNSRARANFREPHSSPGCGSLGYKNRERNIWPGTSTVWELSKRCKFGHTDCTRRYRVDVYFRWDVTGLREAFPFPRRSRRTVYPAGVLENLHGCNRGF